MKRWACCWLMLIALLFGVVGCGKGKYIKVAKINKYNMTKNVVFEFCGMGQGVDCDFVLRHDVTFEGDELPIEVKVKFPDGKFYKEKVVIPLKKGGQFLGERKGGVVDVRFRWRSGMGFGVGERVRLIVSPAMEKIDWSGIEYIGVEVFGATSVKY